MQNRPKPSLNLPKSKPIYKELNPIKQRKTKNQPTPDRIFQKVDPFTKNWTKSNSVKCKTSQLTSNFSFREATTSGLFSSNSGGGGSRTGDSSRADLREILLRGGFDVVLRSDWVGMNVGDFRFQALAFEETLLGRSEEDGEKVNRRDAMTLFFCCCCFFSSSLSPSPLVFFSFFSLSRFWCFLEFWRNEVCVSRISWIGCGPYWKGESSSTTHTISAIHVDCMCIFSLNGTWESKRLCWLDEDR